ncbi:MAG: hypothetical protein ACI4RT_08535, partial [Candidatus Spyradenecus sp.]
MEWHPGPPVLQGRVLAAHTQGRRGRRPSERATGWWKRGPGARPSRAVRRTSRGHAHVRPIYTPGGTSLSGFECLNSWNLCRDLVTGQWYWNPKASDTLDFSSLQAVPQGELCTLVRSRHVDYPAMAIYLRNA